MIKCMGCMREYSAQARECPYCGYSKTADHVNRFSHRPGTALSERYIIGKAFHQDPVGISYIGWDNLIEKKAVIKEYFPEQIAFRIDGREVASDPKWEKLYESGKRAFFQEIENWSHIDEIDGIGRVYDHMMQYGTVYYVREYINGETIGEILEQENPLLFSQARRWMKQIMQILIQLQQKGLSHGNLSVDNIVVTEDQIKLVNFGVRVNENKARGRLFEGSEYIPEELYEDTILFWQKADVYAAAAIFYRMITGQMPYPYAHRKKNERIKSPFELGIWAQPDTEKGLMSILNSDPKKKEITLRKMEQIFWQTNPEMRDGKRKEDKSKKYFLPLLVGIESVIAVVLAIVLILLW